MIPTQGAAERRVEPLAVVLALRVVAEHEAPGPGPDAAAEVGRGALAAHGEARADDERLGRKRVRNSQLQRLLSRSVSARFG